MSVKHFLAANHKLLFYATWLLLHLVQAANTELFDDEAYYWVYSNFPAWGYFDHPPTIAVLIKAGYALFPNEFGVRLLTVLLSTAAIYITDLLVEKKNPALFYAICGTVALAQIGGMLAVPDAPLMFFVALFFYVYRMFIYRMSVLNTFFLGAAIALMLYTKYHAVLIVLFTALSNLKLFRTYLFYVTCLFALLLFTPHLVWQHNNGYPSVQFHLFERNPAGSDIWHTLEFFAGQILLAGPLMGWLLIIAALLYKPVTKTERALKFSFIGIYAFFFISTFRGRAEANWTIPSFIGLIVLSHQYLLTQYRMRRMLYTMLPLTVVLVILARVIMMADLPPAWWIVKDEFHDNKVFVEKIRSRASNNPVVFLDTYQKPSKYWFYSNDTALGLNTPTYRRNNYNFWPLEENYNGRAAYVFGAYDKFFNDGFLLRSGEKNGGRYLPLYYSFSKVRLEDVKTTKIDGQYVSVRFTSKAPAGYLEMFRQQPYDSSSVYLVLYRKDKVVRYIPSNMTVKDITSPIQHHIVTFDMPGNADAYTCKLAISNCLPGRPSLNSTRFQIKIE